MKDNKCGYCFVEGEERTSGSCLPTYPLHPERYADPSFNISFRCDENNFKSSSSDIVWADNYCPTEYAWMAILGLALFVIGFAPGKTLH